MLPVHIASAPIDKIICESLNHRFVLEGRVVDENGQPLDKVTVHSWSVPPSFDVKEEEVKVDNRFAIDRHGREILLWFTKDGYRDAKLSFFDGGADMEPSSSAACPQLRPVSHLGHDMDDAEFYLGEEHKSLTVVLRRHEGAKPRTITAEISPTMDPETSPFRFTRKMLPPGKWAPSLVESGDPVLEFTVDHHASLAGVPLVRASQEVRCLEDMPVCPLLAFFGAGFSLDLNEDGTQPALGKPYFFFARIGLCYARGMVTVQSMQAGHERAKVTLQIQEDGSRDFRFTGMPRR